MSQWGNDMRPKAQHVSDQLPSQKCFYDLTSARRRHPGIHPGWTAIRQNLSAFIADTNPSPKSGLLVIGCVGCSTKLPSACCTSTFACETTSCMQSGFDG